MPWSMPILAFVGGWAVAADPAPEAPAPEPTSDPAPAPATEPDPAPEKPLPRDYDRRYQAFGGVSFGHYGYPVFQKIAGQHFGVPASGVYSHYLAQLGDSRFYAGFGVGANFYNWADSSEAMIDIQNPYPEVETIAGNWTYTERFYHLPIESNSAYVWRFQRMLMWWVGAGFSLHLLDYSQIETHSAIATDTTNGELLFWSDDFRVGGTSFKTRPGFQVFTGFEFIFGKIPRIGGEWGLSLQTRYQQVASFKVKNRRKGPEYAYREEYLNPALNTGGFDFADPGSDFEAYDVDNLGISVGLGYHF